MRNRTLPGKYMIGSWQNQSADETQDELEKQVIATQHLQVVRCSYKVGSDFSEHVHQTEQITIVESGKLRFDVAGDTIDVNAGQMISICPGVSHSCKVCGEEVAQALNLFHNPNSATEN